MLVVLLFAFYMGEISIPIPTITVKEKRPRIGLTKVPVFHLFPARFLWQLCSTLKNNFLYVFSVYYGTKFHLDSQLNTD